MSGKVMKRKKGVITMAYTHLDKFAKEKGMQIQETTNVKDMKVKW